MTITIRNILRATGMGASLLLCLGLSACGSSDESSNPAMPASTVPTVTIASPAQNAALPAGPATVAFTVQNFTIGGMAESHLQFSR